MKFTVQFKDPGALGDAIKAAAQMSAERIDGLSEDEREAVEEKRAEAFRALCDKWFRYGEYVEIEIDTEAKTATVVPQR